MEQANPETQKKMVDILKAVQKEEEEEGDEQETDEVASLVQRLEQTDIDAETAWSYLTPDERQEFERMVQTGDVGKLVPLWKPWWEEKVLVTEVTTEEHSTPTVQPLSALTSKPPAASEAVQAVLQKVVMTQSVAATEELPSLLGAFRKFLSSPQLKDNALRALDETRSVFDAAAREPECKKEMKQKLRRAIKKVEYMMSWTVEYGDKLLSCLNDIDVEALAVAENMSTFQDACKAVEEQRNKTSKPRVLIEELN
ncbi:hypothetical protein MTO96_021149 [Rhipicephalus appendiculatus]